MIDIETRGLDEMIARARRMGGNVDVAARLAVNDAARLAVRQGGKQILDEINYPKSYLKGKDGRLAVSKFATTKDLEAVVKGRDRPTSLARFAQGVVRFGRNARVRVKVASRGAARTLQHAFFMKLRRGTEMDGANANIGLAVRVPKGESLRNSRGAKQIGDSNLYLLYGPSVDQAFQGVAADIVDDVSDEMESEFIRQFERLN